MPDYRLRYRNLSGGAPETPLTDLIEAPSEQAAIAALKARLPGQDLRIETARRTDPAPKKRKTRAEWIVLALVLLIGGINLIRR